jgi:hypothetical protein
VCRKGENDVIPAKAGIQVLEIIELKADWMPAFAGMTNYDSVSRGEEISGLSAAVFF